jgi:lipopolysaccharide transport system ATP-binding protein
MRLRLGFAVAAHLDPDVLIIDEVLAVGDAGFQKKCLSAMEGLRSSGRTVLFVSHNMAAVENLCSRGIWIDSGSVREDGPAQQVIQSYMGTFAESQQATIELDKAQRRGSGEIRYTGLEFVGADGEPLAVVRSGDRVIVRMHYHASKAIEFPSFGFRLTTELGTLVTETSTWHHGIEIPHVAAGDGHIDLDIGALNLLPARYFFSLGLTGSGGHAYDLLDYCARLDIETANIYNSGRSFDSRWGIVFFPQSWRLNGATLGRSASREEAPHVSLVE